MAVNSPKSKHICDIFVVESFSSSGAIVIAGRGEGVLVFRNCKGF